MSGNIDSISGAPISPGMGAAGTNLTIVAGAADYWHWGATQNSQPRWIVVTNNTIGDVFLKAGATTMAPATSNNWATHVVKPNQTIWVPPCLTIAGYVPAGGETLVYSGTAKNFFVLGYM